MRALRSTVQAECGLVALAMIARHRGASYSLLDMRQRLSPSSKGTTARQLLLWGEQLGLQGKVLRLRLKELGSLSLPAILHWRFTHYVVVERVKRNGLVIADPATGRRFVTLEEASEAFTGIALEFRGSAKDKSSVADSKRLKIREIWPQLNGGKLAQTLIWALTVLSFASILAMPIFVQRLVDQHIGSLGNIYFLCFVFAVIGLCGVLAQLLKRWMSITLGTAISSTLVGSVANHLFDLRPDWFEKRSIGDVLSRFESSIEIQKFVVTHLATAVVDFGLIVFLVVAVVIYNPEMAGVIALLLAFQMLLVGVGAGILKGMEERRLIASSRQTSLFQEIVRNVASMKVRRGESRRWAKWHNLYDEYLDTERRYQSVDALVIALTGATTTLGPILIAGFAWPMVQTGAVTVGHVMGAIMLYVSMSASASRVGISLQEFLRTQVHLERMSEILLSPISDSKGMVPITPQANQPALKVSGIDFRYSLNEPRVLKNAALEVNDGETVALSGPSGSGKSTLVRIILGLSEPSAGEVYFRGELITDENRGAFLSSIGVVLQDDQLMSGTIAENIAFFDQLVDEERVAKVAALAEIAADIDRLPMKYNTQVAELGISLSGGQRQRLTIARALYSDPRMLILDEATSALDIKTEGKIISNLQDEGLTLLLVSHRPNVISMCGRVYCVEAGEVKISEGKTSPRKKLNA